jgi:hypothetical protein
MHLWKDSCFGWPYATWVRPVDTAWVSNRTVFYSIPAAPRIEGVLRHGGQRLLSAFQAACKDWRTHAALQNNHIARACDRLLEVLIEKDKPTGV